MIRKGVALDGLSKASNKVVGTSLHYNSPLCR